MDSLPFRDWKEMQFSTITYNKTPLEFFLRTDITKVHDYDVPIAYITVEHPLLVELERWSISQGYGTIYKEAGLRVKLKKCSRDNQVIPGTDVSGPCLLFCAFTVWKRDGKSGVTCNCKHLEVL